MVRYRLVPLLLVSALLTLAAWAQQSSTPRVVDLKTTDGTILKASYFAAANPGPGVLLLHQCNRQRKVWDELAAQLSSSGINVLTLDLRGFGESGGIAHGKLTPRQAAQVQAEDWPGDINVALQYLVTQPGVNRDVIGVGGASCGVDNSIETARRHPAEVKSLVLLSGGTTLAGRRFLRQASQLPILFAVADNDEFPPTAQVVPWLYSISSNPGKRFVSYASGGHGADMFKVHPELRGVITDWFVTTLIKTPGNAPFDKNATPVCTLAEVLNKVESPGGVEEVIQKLTEARRSDPKGEIFPEDLVNVMGYDHLQVGDSKAAIEIFKLNVMAYPQSPNVYDSLSDAYVADGQNELARQNAKKALELLVTDTTDPEARRNGIRDNSQQKLKQLGEGQP